MKKLILLASLMTLFAAAAYAQVAPEDGDFRQYPIFAKERLTIGARAEYSWLGDAQDEKLFDRKHLGVGLVGSYGLVPKLSATLRVVYFVDFRPQYALGVNLLLYRGLK